MFLGEYSLILRLDSKYTFHYVLDDENNNKTEDRTVFGVKPLTIIQYAACKDILIRDKKEGVYVGSFYYRIVEYGLCNWENYVYADNKEPITFNNENINTIPFEAIEELARAILFLSEVDEVTENQIRVAVQWSDYLSKQSKPEYWTCDHCKKANLTNKRNCNGDSTYFCIQCGIETQEQTCPKCKINTRPSFSLNISKKPNKFAIHGIEYLTQCPLAIIKPSTVSLINTVSFIDDSHSLPVSGAALEQSNYYYQTRQIMLSQRNENMKEDTKVQPSQAQPTGVSHLKQSFSNRRK